MNTGIMTPAWGVYCTLDETERVRDRQSEGGREETNLSPGEWCIQTPPAASTPAHARPHHLHVYTNTFPTCLIHLIIVTVVVGVVSVVRSLV